MSEARAHDDVAVPEGRPPAEVEAAQEGNAEPNADPGPPRVTKSLTWRFIMMCVHVLYRTVWPTRVEGAAHVPRRGRAVIVSNHQSFLDIPLLARAAHHRHLSFVARDTLARSRVLGFVMRSCGAILIGRGRADRAALRRIADHLEAEDVVVVFAEGTRTRDGLLQAPKKGALAAARRTGAPIVPAAIDGSYRAWPPTRRLPHPGRLRVRFAAPIDATRPDALEAAWAEVERLVGELDPSSLPPPAGSTPGADSH